MTEPVIVAEIVRNDFVEGHHYGSVVVTAPDGTVEWSVGVVDRPMFPRSSNKPMQALGMLRLGLQLEGRLLALAGASHSGEQIHLDGVREILASVDLNESALQTPPAYPVDDETRDEWVRAGGVKDPITMNCSGKHAAMLATAATNGWDLTTYRDADHPVQQGIRTAIEDSAGEKVAAVAIDGCGAPLLAISLAGLARSFGLFAAAAPDSHEGRIADAFRAFPEYASGTRRDEAELMRAVPGLFCKVGAEAVYAVGLPDGRGIALKIDDGGVRARKVVMAATLQRLGISNPVIESQLREPLLGGGKPVGSVHAVGSVRG
ncbi:asparaginase [Kribbella deserti]|uniref:Asparaginase n=1 Tax=Kribbella deserti TaxID=1926257 RepID=A0ABV6QHK9_9ACTN